MEQLTVDIIIPTYKPGEAFRKLLRKLKNQTYPLNRILVMNTEEAFWKEELVKGIPNLQVVHLDKKEFNHGGTRARAVGMSQAEVFICMTQDALPADERLVEELIKALSKDNVKAAYARQLPYKDCREAERFTRSFNYPPNSRIKTEEDLPVLGIKTFFCSNVCAAYDRKTYEELGGFVAHTIFNEDMIYAGKLIQAGYAVAYAAAARVVHSHNYSCKQQFHRNFDLGVSQAQHPEIFANVPSEGEGMKLVKRTASHLCSLRKPWLLWGLFWQSAYKYAGYFLGKRYQHLPRRVILFCTDNKEYWTDPQ